VPLSRGGKIYLRAQKIIGFNIGIIRSWRSQFGKIPARDFPDNRCYTFFLQEKMPKQSVGTV